jgi:hypothetical protein
MLGYHAHACRGHVGRFVQNRSSSNATRSTTRTFLRPFVLFASLVCLFTAGCDPVRTTSQTVHLLVIESASRKVVNGAQVSLKYDYTAEPMPKGWRMTPQEYENYQRQNWEHFPWSRGVTDRNGIVNVSVQYTALDRTRGPEPPPNRDWVTGRSYVVQVRHDDVPSGTLRLTMKPGQSANGKSYTVVFLSTDKPFYIDKSN